MKQGPNPRVFMTMAAAMLVAGSGALYFQYGALESARVGVADLRKKDRTESSLRQELESATKHVADVQLRLNHLEEGVPTFAYVPTMLAELEKTGRDSGIMVLGVRPLPKPPPQKTSADAPKPKRKPYEEMEIEVKGRGNYDAVRKFVTALNSFPKIVAARMVTMTPKVDPNNPSDLLDVSVQLRAFLFPAEDAPKGASTNG
ncbi:MAG: type 4a pilus biogenesis protein PilO [Fimbriimonas ginsengisoli]|uniref:Type 4a pilus biogenesis protein PilO n=1 Tax=Fimbriimonas ginsengisoli TaxID=1005039 RepID=A0A931LQH5_FIMGI|nr:type 4a pilus biogenesis protein PilO [Fimbriimonas ginsengisoli]